MGNQSRREVMQLAAAAALVGAVATKAAQAQLATGAVIDANMHWLPEDLFADEQLLSALVEPAPREYDIHAKVAPAPGRPLRQITIEQPAVRSLAISEAQKALILGGNAKRLFNLA